MPPVVDTQKMPSPDHRPITGGEQADAVVIAAQEGAEWAWQRIHRELAGPMEGYLRARGAREPEDLVGETFVHLARGIGRFEGGWSEFRSWAFVVAHHRLIDERRRLGRRPVMADDAALADRPSADDPEGEALGRLGTDAVRRILSLLTPAQQDVLALRVIAGLTADETARVLGKKPGAVRVMQHRALERLRKTLEQEVTR
jgi:RNA polymerase sigma factor (sigma-70 family)